MRKVLSFVLVLALVLSSFSMAFADDAATTTTDAAVTAPAETPAPAETATIASALSDIVGLDCEQAVKVLVDLGVIQGYTDGTYKPENTVTRAEAAVIVIKALGLEKSVGSQKSSYTDMSGYGWAEPYIAFASNLGILQGYGDGTYKPGATVSYNEFAAIMVRALGYTTDSLTGTWPGNYVNKAAGLGIMDDITSGGSNGANRGDVAIMTANNLTNYIGTIDKDGNFQETIISGTVAAGNAKYDNFVYRLGGDEITDVVTDVDDAVINARQYLGQYCTYYVNDDDEIIAVKEVKSTKITGDFKTGTSLVLEGDDDVDYNLPADGSWDYTNAKDKESKHYAINNGICSPASDGALAVDTNDVTMEVKLSGKTVKEIYSVQIWNRTDAAKVEASDLEDLKDAELLGYDFETNKDDSIKENSYELVGVTSLDKIKADNIVYIYTENTSDKYIRKVAVGTQVIEGTVTKDNGEDAWTVNKVKYSFATDPATTYKDNLDNDVKLFLDAYGDIYDYDTTSGSADNYAVIKDGDGSFGSIKLFLADGTSKVFESDLDAAAGSALVGTAGNDGEIVAYSLDKDGVIDKLEGPSKVSNAAVISNKVLKVSEGGVDTNYTIDDDVVVFTSKTVGNVDDLDTAKIADVDKFDKSKAEAGQFSNMSVYIDDNKVVAIIVDDSIVSGTGTDSYAVVSEASKAVNAAGDKAQELTGFIDGKKMNDVFTSDDDTCIATSDLRTGVLLFKIKYDDSNNISKLTSVDLVTGATSVAGLLSSSEAGLQYAADGYLKLGTTTVSDSGIKTYAIADNAVVYGATTGEFGTSDFEYSKYSGSIKAGTAVWLFNFDDDDDEYDVVVVAK